MLLPGMNDSLEIRNITYFIARPKKRKHWEKCNRETDLNVMREYKTILFGVQSHVCLSSRPEGNSFKTLLTLQRTRARQTLMQRGEREQLPVCPSF